MRPTEDDRALSVEFDAHHCRLSDADTERMRGDLDALARQVAHFPTARLHVLVEYNNRNNDYSVKTSLSLSGAATLVASDHAAGIHAAWETCLRNLSREVQEYKERLGRLDERSKTEQGTRQRLEPDLDPDLVAIDAAVEAGDYPAFREATIGFEEPLRKRIGRWIERYPEIDARVGRGLTIADVVEDVFLTAFEGWTARPVEIRAGDWLEGLIDPTARALRDRPDEELEAVRMARSLRGVPAGPEES